jgi:hypothetical protein
VNARQPQPREVHHITNCWNGLCTSTERRSVLTRPRGELTMAPFDGRSDAFARGWHAGMRLWCRARWHRATRLRTIVAETLLVVGLILAPALAMCDFTVWLNCHDLDTNACLAMLSLANSAEAAMEAGMASGVARR